MNRNEVIAAIKAALKARSGKTWSVTGGRGTAYGWITISSPPARRLEFGYMSAEDRAELAKLLGKSSVHQQGESIPAASDYYQEYIDRANGRTPSKIGQPYWD
ncbi:MAG: hypothetical protein JNM76_14510 [Betaproteobacteria bacterium]|nr:hypothetical protein [Betaproteobacteria bacterium]